MDYKKFIEIAKIIELCIQNDKDYKECIQIGYFTERFNNVYKKVSKILKDEK